MAIQLGANQYGKAENRVVRIVRDTPVHEIKDLNVSTSLRGDFADAHTHGDQAAVLPTDTQKNTAFAYAKLHGVDSVEDYALALGRRLLDAARAAHEAEIRVEEYAWDRLGPHSFVRRGGAVRTCTVTVTRGGARVESGVGELTVLNSTDSEFKGFLKDEFTTLAETDDRILATSLVATWRHASAERQDWNASYDKALDTILTTFAGTYSRALQETLYAMGRAVLEGDDGLTDIHFRAPNKHHFLVDFSGFRVDGLTNDGEVFHAADRPYGLIEATVVRTPEVSREQLLACLAVPRWADEVLAGGPYADREALLGRADEAARQLSDAELEQALAGHPRIGERGGAQSQSEQSGVSPSDRLAQANAAYEQRFDRVFLIRAAGRDAEEILAELERRMQNDDAAERAETVDNLRQIALLRLEQSL
ncbi:urate oxidase [Nocardioides anomalus]|uniref:factor independent urate hydroxylase n=1 Tax=Nocardioides anomalus TaxID=2712223 RepID=A0A6G6WEW3_9ACTN|nr:urate oxidase [Nocardioides anomalus]QIG43580.1 urate oxidase [Nocardioides anomalus]